jgi:hypothetical protein
MKKLVILLLVMVVFVSPTSAQQAGRKSRGSQGSLNAAKLLNAYNRMNRANNQTGANAPSGQTKSSFNAFSNVNPAVPGTPSPGAAPTDRPFDVNAAAINPFSPTAPSSSNLSNPSATFGPGVDVFSPGPLTVNPFSPGNLSAAGPLPNTPGISPTPAMSPGMSLSTSQNAPSIRKSPQLQRHPLGGLSQKGSPVTSNPFNSLSVLDPLGVYGNPYASYNPFPTTSLQP